MAREIAVSLVAAVAFAGGLYAYLRSSMPVASGSGLVTQPAAARGPDDLQLASDVAGRFVAALHAKQHAAAYALMANPYRARFSLEEFRAQYGASQFLSHAERVSLARTHREVPAGVSPSSTSLRGQGSLISAMGSLDVAFTFVRDADGELRISALTLAGSPILSGV